MKSIVMMCSFFALFCGETDAMFNQKNDSQETLISEENQSVELIEVADNSSNLRDPSLFSSDIDEVKEAIVQGHDINEVKLGTTPLANAIVSNSDAVALYLLDQGADPNQETRYGFPLDLAMKKKNTGLAKALIKKGANIFNVFNILNLENQLSKF